MITQALSRAAPALLAIAALALSAGCESLGRNYEAALLLGDVQAGAFDSRLKRATEEPEVEPVSYLGPDGERRVADRYRPGGEPARGALVLVHGFTEDGKDDRRLVQFANTLARSGFDVLTPEVESLTRFAVTSDNVQDVIAAARHHAGETGQPVTVAVFSLMVGPAVIAALDPEAGEAIDAIVGVGGYFDLPAAIVYATTGYDPISGRDDLEPPRPEGKWLVMLSQLEHVDDEADREHLRAIARRRLDDPEADVGERVQALGADGRAVYEFMTNEDPDRFDRLLERLPAGARAELRALDLTEHDLGRLEASLLLVHGLHDNVIPYGHSAALHEAVGGRPQSRLHLAGGLQHVDIDPGIMDAFRLWRAAVALLRLRDDAW